MPAPVPTPDNAPQASSDGARPGAPSSGAAARVSRRPPACPISATARSAPTAQRLATLHVVGSNNGLEPWTGNTAGTNAQIREESARMQANLANMKAAFRGARRHGARAVVLVQHADMFDPTVTDPQLADYSAFIPRVRSVVREANSFRGPVYLFTGDSHRFRRDRPLTAASPWLSFYGIQRSAGNLRRITVDGSDLGENDYLRVTVNGGRRNPLTVRRIATR